MKNKRAQCILAAFAMLILLTTSVFAGSQSGNLGSRGSYSFSCSSGWFLNKYVSGSSSASYNGDTSGGYLFSDGRARVDVSLTDGTNNSDYDDFSGSDTSGNASVTVYGLNSGSAYCYARVSGVLLFDDGTYSPTNSIEASTLNP